MRTPDDVMDQLLAELGGSLGVLLTALGVRHGLWTALAGAGPLDPAAVSRRSGIAVPYAREWLRAQAAAGYLELDPAGERYTLPDGVGAALLHGPGGAMVDACTTMFCSMASSLPQFEDAFRSGRGFGWQQRDAAYWQGTDALTRAALPAPVLAAAVGELSGVADALAVGGRLADVGCGYGAPTRMLAEAFPAARVSGFDDHDASVAAARKAAAEAGLADRVQFEVAAADRFPGTGYALITFVDALHDMGDPVGALAHARAALAPGGAVLLVEPLAADTVAANLTPLGRMFYAVSTLVCTPNALAQAVGPQAPLGTLAGEPALTAVARAAGFAEVRRLATAAPMNLLLELRP